MNGFLNLNKPQNFTSHDCVAKLRKILKTKKIGHGGTLDPLATGVLPIAVGKATRLLQFLPSEKAYKARIKFGIQTTTDDLEGEIIRQQEVKDLTLAKIMDILPEFIGEIDQIPPAYSAIKKDGKKLYDLARKGAVIDIPIRKVFINKIEILNWQESDYPELDLKIVCGGGTYIRAIARDLGEKIGTGATLANLQRTLSCGMTLENSLTFEDVINQKTEEKLSLINLDFPLQNMPKIYLNEEESKNWLLGQKISKITEANYQFYCTYNHKNQFIGISEQRETIETNIKPKIVIYPNL
ncbi:tRNA pseudouridine(55) synthase TruB [Cyanobacterium aponinum]|uniref:tRNA pseudouridine synthase B n=1 Tax=Cyanobacterium aponinum (strain PCC 10605) TaxID=755178 RepID=K9Z6B0_CYAAP|nr:tRNA pseudouridine(55) synthase TruB [Cyanobacterium aponinum]AFZ54711.1 tRNA pseudouridine synthase B [Cyanobacterium aponinum PCC 10605]